MGEVDATLRELHAGGFTALASDVVGLRPQKVWRPAFLRLGRPPLCLIADPGVILRATMLHRTAAARNDEPTVLQLPLHPR